MPSVLVAQTCSEAAAPFALPVLPLRVAGSLLQAVSHSSGPLPPPVCARALGLGTQIPVHFQVFPQENVWRQSPWGQESVSISAVLGGRDESCRGPEACGSRHSCRIRQSKTEAINFTSWKCDPFSFWRLGSFRSLFPNHVHSFCHAVSLSDWFWYCRPVAQECAFLTRACVRMWCFENHCPQQ